MGYDLLNTIKMISRLLALVFLIVLSPILFITAFFIFIEDGSPVLLKQRRYGKNKKLFLIYKFRSMKNNTPIISRQNLHNGSFYYLKCGSFIRDYRIDEIPNFLNIIKRE
jgi:O-antigen biosynthesis protein WbqP